MKKPLQLSQHNDKTLGWITEESWFSSLQEQKIILSSTTPATYPMRTGGWRGRGMKVLKDCSTELYTIILPADHSGARFKAWNVFARLNAGIMGSNPTQGMDVCVRLFCVCVFLCVGSGLATGWSPVQGGLPTGYWSKKLKKGPRAKKRTAES
jgi:hypothetical protein